TEAQRATARHQRQRHSQTGQHSDRSHPRDKPADSRPASTSLRTEPATEWVEWGDGQVGTGPGSRMAADPFAVHHQPGVRPAPQRNWYSSDPTPEYFGGQPTPSTWPQGRRSSYSPGWSGKAVVALVLAFFIPPIAAIVAIVALIDIRSSGRRGTGI